MSQLFGSDMNSRKLHVLEHESVVSTTFFFCIPGDPKPSITWRKDGRVLASGLKYSVQNDGELIIRHAQFNDGGAYECVARTSRERVEAFTNLVVRGARKTVSCLLFRREANTRARLEGHQM